MVVERYSYGLYGDPDTQAFVDTTRTNLLVSQDAIDKHAEVFSWSIDYIGTDGLRGDLRADVDGDGMISSWDQLRFAQQQTAWAMIYIDQLAANSDEAIDGWSTLGQLSRPHPVGMKPTGEPLDAGTASQPGPRYLHKLRGLVQLDNRLGYAGYVWDPFLQMYHVRHRVLNPRLGIWMQPDPIGYAGGWNLHEYAGGDPMRFVDPMGLDLWDWVTTGEWSPAENVRAAARDGFVKGAHDGFLVTTNSAVNTITFGKLGMTREELAAGGHLYDAENKYLLVSEISGNIMGEALKTAALAGLGNVAQCGTKAGQAIKAALQAKSAYDEISAAAESVGLAIEVVQALAEGDLDRAAELALEKGQQIALQKIASKLAKKIADGIECFVAGTQVSVYQYDDSGFASTPSFKPIEAVQVGDRVPAGDSNAAGIESEIVPSEWREFVLELGTSPHQQSGGQQGVRSGTLSLLRPLTWLEQNRLTMPSGHYGAKGEVWVSLVIPEWGLEGAARVLEIKPCPEIRPGPGRLVLMKSTTRYTGDMATITLAGSCDAITGTSGHPIFSIDRAEYVHLGDLMPGERVRTADGWATVEAMSRWRGQQEVYNLEVDGEHRFFVGSSKVESHNAGPCKVVTVDATKHPASAEHIEAAQAGGKPSVLTIDRSNARQRRAAATAGQQRTSGKDLDEYPPAMFQQGGAGASTASIPSSDNRGAGAAIGNQLRGVPDGSSVEVRVKR